jgi:Protein of unknown function (DUF2523)
MVAILKLIWRVISKVVPGLGMAMSSATGLLVASAAARALAVSAALVAFVLWMPMPAWLASIPGYAAQIPVEVVYVMQYARIKEGVTIILGAYVVRFLARLALRAIG